jgi:hypothetical protein
MAAIQGLAGKTSVASPVRMLQAEKSQPLEKLLRRVDVK